MKKLKLLITALPVIVAVVFYAGHVRADRKNAPKVEYSADVTTDIWRGKVETKLYYAHGNERQEIKTGKNTTNILIVRRDKKVVWVLMPESNRYTELDIDSPETRPYDDPTDMVVRQTVVGHESVNGIPATKKKVVIKRGRSKEFDGYQWVSKDGITVRFELLAKKGRKMEMKNLKIGKQAPSLFELPKGYVRMDTVSDLMNGRR